MTTLNAESLPLTRGPIAKTAMLIRTPVGDVFEAILNPEVTTDFWFTKATGGLEVGKRVQWDWQMYNVSIDVMATGPPSETPS